MARTSANKSNSRTPHSPAPEPKKRWQPSDNLRWVVSFTLFCVALFILASIISHYFTWRADQMLAKGTHNLCGPHGARISRVLVGDWFGIFAVGIPAIISILAVRLLLYRWDVLPRSLTIITSFMILGSVTFGFAFDTRWDVFGSGLGGKMGIDVANFLVEGHIGKLGMVLLIVLCGVLLTVYCNRRTITKVNSIAQKTVDALRPKQSPEEEEDSVYNEEYGIDNTPLTPAAEEPEDIFEVGQQEELDLQEPQTDQPTEPTEEEDDNLIIMVEEDEEPTVVVGDQVATVAEQEEATTVVAEEPQAGDEQDIIEVVCFDEPQESGMSGLPKNSEAQEPEISLGTGGVVAEDEEGNLQVIRTEHNEQEVGKIGSLYDPTRELARYQRPPIEILEKYEDGNVQFSREEIDENKTLIQQTLGSFGIKIKKIIATIGPTVTLYEIEPEMGMKAAKIRALEDDIAISLKALSIRLIVPMPGRGTIGIEIPNRTRRTVSMYSMMRSAKFQESKYELPIALGKTIQNETFVIDLAKMPHLLVAGATGQGKSVGLNVIINSLIYKKHPAELKFVMVDPKKVELSLYAKLEKHFLAKMESEEDAVLTDTQRVVYTLNSLCNEMQARYELLRTAEVRKISEYNQKFLQRKLNPQKGHRYLPYIVVVIDEFADMIMTAGKEVETPIVRLGQLARAVGIHLIIATQRPDVKVITGLIKANCPSRIAFKVTSMVDSRTILDQSGAQKLVGMGDMLVSINGETTRLQCAFIDTPEIERVTEFVAKQRSFSSAYLLPDYVPENGDMGSNEPRERLGDLDEMFEEVARFVVGNQQGSTSFVQRKFKIGYTRAARIMDDLESMGIVGPANGAKPREVLIADPASLERILTDIFIENS